MAADSCHACQHQQACHATGRVVRLKLTAIGFHARSDYDLDDCALMYAAVTLERNAQSPNIVPLNTSPADFIMLS